MLPVAGASWGRGPPLAFRTCVCGRRTYVSCKTKPPHLGGNAASVAPLASCPSRVGKRLGAAVRLFLQRTMSARLQHDRASWAAGSQLCLSLTWVRPESDSDVEVACLSGLPIVLLAILGA